MSIALAYRPRPWQEQVHRERKRFTIVEAHRRSGKSELALGELAYALLATPGVNALYAAPLKAQSKSVIWDRAKRFFAPVLSEARESEGRLILTNASTLLVSGAGDEAVHLRGLSFVSAVLDEYAQFESPAWHSVIRPALADSRGESLFISTPSGRDALWHLKRETMNDPDWKHFNFPVGATNVLDPNEIESLKRSMSPHAYALEFLCDADSPLPSAIFGTSLAALREKGRIRNIAMEPALTLGAALDLGVSDSTACWMYQKLRGEVRVLGYLEVSGVSLRDVAHKLKTQGVTELILPADIRVRELTSARSRLEMIMDMGFSCNVLPNSSLEEGLDVANRLLTDRCYFDGRYCGEGLAHLRSYTRDEKTGRPKHNEHSHGSDAFRYMALGVTNSRPVIRDQVTGTVELRESFFVRSSKGSIRKVTPR